MSDQTIVYLTWGFLVRVDIRPEEELAAKRNTGCGTPNGILGIRSASLREF